VYQLVEPTNHLNQKRLAALAATVEQRSEARQGTTWSIVEHVIEKHGLTLKEVA